MILDRRIYRTVDGRLVEEGDTEAAFLEYPEGAELPDETARKLGLLKESKPAANKARSAPANKAAKTADS